MPSSSKPSTTSPITRVSYDVLREIFIHCLPQHPLEDRQPNTTVAPLLLCHICSSWRTVALASASLWLHLSYCLTLDCGENIQSDFVKKDIEFVRWWRLNQGSIAPFLSLAIKYKDPRDIQEPAGNGMQFILEYISTAQYLDLDSFYWARLRERIKAGDEVVFPCLHTLEKSGWAGADPFYHVQISISPHAFPMLRRLSLTNDMLRPNSIGQVPIHWSSLTHISFHDIVIALPDWFSFIRAVPNLQWGNVEIISYCDPEEYTEPPEYSLTQLSTFGMTFRHEKYDLAALSMLFANLHLPAVHTLALSWRTTETRNDTTIAELYTILNSTPAVRTLALGECFFPKVDDRSLASALAIEHVEPIWKYATYLTDLQLELPGPSTAEASKPEVEEVVGILRDILFSEYDWLDLRNPACPIRAVTIVDNAPMSEGSDWDREADGGIIDFIMSNIQKHAEKTPNIVFQLASESAGDIIANARKEWDSSM